MSNTKRTPTVRISAEVTRQIRQHARSSMTTEVCGVLIGDLLDGSEKDTDIFASIAAVNAAQAGTHVTFTQDAWEHIYKIKDAEYPEERIVGWYHSHPGFGVFLSEHDTFIQENFFSSANQVAWVFDPHTDEEGCFGWMDGKITRLESILIADEGAPVKVSESRELAASALQSEDEIEDARGVSASKRSPRWLSWVTTSLSLLFALLIGFAISHFLFRSIYLLELPMNPMTGQPMLRDPKTDAPIYLDPQSGKPVTLDRQTGKISTFDLNQLRGAAPSTLPSAPPQTAPAPSPAPTPKEKK